MSMIAAIGERAISRRMLSEQASERAFLAISTLLFFVSAAITIVSCGSMSAMSDMPMPGGWTMSMAWMLMPGQTWLGAVASFLGMWVVMRGALMVPPFSACVLRYRQQCEQNSKA